MYRDFGQAGYEEEDDDEGEAAPSVSASMVSARSHFLQGEASSASAVAAFQDDGLDGAGKG